MGVLIKPIKKSCERFASSQPHLLGKRLEEILPPDYYQQIGTDLFYLPEGQVHLGNTPVQGDGF